MDTLVKALEFGAKYAWAVFFVSAFLLFMPDKLVAQLELLSLRKANAPYLWLVLLFTGALAVGTILPTASQAAWRFFFCPIKKLLFPAVDLRTQIKQSRIRYFRVQFSYRNGDKPLAYEAIDSNGTGCGFYDENGKRMLPTEPNDGHVRLHGGQFQHPAWGRFDWHDIFNGNPSSGCWGITER